MKENLLAGAIQEIGCIDKGGFDVFNQLFTFCDSRVDVYQYVPVGVV